MANEHEGVSPAGAHHGVAGIDYGLTVRPAIPEPFRRMFWVAAEDIANVIGCTVVEGEPRGYGGPDPRDTDPGKLREIANALHALLGEEDCTERAVTLGHLWYLVRLVAGLLDAISDRNRPGPPKPDPRDAEIERLRAELVDYRTRLGNDLLRGGELVERVRAAMRVDDGGTCTRASIGVVGDYLGRLIDVLDVEVRQHEQTTAELAERHRELGQVRAELVRERAIYADSPDDRLYHAADNTWWRRNDNGRLVEAEMPELGDITAERDQLRQQLDQHLADENSAQAANDRLRDEIQNLNAEHDGTMRYITNRLADILDADTTDTHELLNTVALRIEGGDEASAELKRREVRGTFQPGQRVRIGLCNGIVVQPKDVTRVQLEGTLYDVDYPTRVVEPILNTDEEGPF